MDSSRCIGGLPLVDDLYEIIPRVLADGPIFYGQYSPQADGALRYRFTP